MRKKILYFFIFTVAAILQLSVIPIIFSEKTMPDMVLMLILAWSIIDGFFAFLSWAIFFGIYYDLISYAFIGLHSLIFLAVVYFVSFFSRRITTDFKGIGSFIFLIYIIVATLSSHIIILLAQIWKFGSSHVLWKMFSSPGGAFVEIFYNTIIFFICFFLIKKIKKFYAIEV